MQTNAQSSGSTAPDLAPSAPRTVTLPGADGKPITLAVPHTVPEMEQLLARRTELGNQLSSVTDRRSSLAAELEATTDQQARAGLQERLKVLDLRTLQLETDLATTGQQIAAAPAALAGMTGSEIRPNGGNDDDYIAAGIGIGSFGTAFLLGAVYLFRRRKGKKRRGSNQPSALPDESAQRLERLEQGMEAIAIEIERVSEGQRFVTRLLSESQSPLTERKLAQPLEANAAVRAER